MRSSHALSIGFLTLGASLSALALTADSAGVPQAQDAANPYQAIVDRNLFALKPPPPPPDPNDAKLQHPPAKIVLQGVTSILGRWQVLGRVQATAKPPEPAKEISFVLSEGQREGEVEVVSIDGKSGTVKVLNGGTEQVLTMEKDGAKPPAGGGPPAPGVPPPATPVLPGFQQAGAVSQPAFGGFPTRTVRSEGRLGVASSGANPPISPTGTAMDPNQPNLGFGTYGSGVSVNAATAAQEAAARQAAAQRSPEENVILYEANRLKNEELANAGLRPRMPRHSYLGDDGSSQQQQQPVPNQNIQSQVPLPFRK